MRTTKELLEVMLEHKNLFENTGLCGLAGRLEFRDIINHQEWRRLRDYIKHNRPSKYSSLECFKQRHSAFYWRMGNLAPRVEWIKKHIKKLL